MSSRLSIRSAAATTPSAVDTSKAQRDEVSKIQQDINVLNQKIAELRGEPTPAVDPDSASVNSASPFVVGLRSLAEQERKFKDVKDLRINAMEKLMERVAEYDRLLLKETTPVVDPTAIPQRRKSFGQDLYCLPTHLHLTARLMDLHAASKRVTVIKTVDGAGTSTASCAVPPNPADKKVIDGLKATVIEQAKQIEDAETKRLNSEEEIQQLKRSNDELKAHIQTLHSKPPVIVAEETHKETEAKRLRSEQEMQQLKRSNEELMTQLQDLRNRPPVVVVEETPKVSAPPVIDYSVEVRQLRERVLELERQTDTLQQRVEVEVGNYQGMVAVALGKASRLNNHTELSGKGDDCVNLVSSTATRFTSSVNYVIDLFRSICSRTMHGTRTTCWRRQSRGDWTG
jgi:cell division protein FtsB